MSGRDTPEAFLKEANVAVLATVGPGGRAHAAPIWYLYEDGVLIVSTGRGSQKHRNVERNPGVTLVAERRSLPYYAVMVRGRAQVGPPLLEEARLRMAVRYLGEELGRAYVAANPGGDSVTIRIRPDRIIEYHGRAGRGQGA